MLRIEDDVGNIAHAEFKAVVFFQDLPLHSLAINEGPMLAALVDDVETSIFGNDDCVIARNARVGNDEILINLATDGERAVVEIDGLLFIALHEHQGGKDSRT